MKNGRSFQCLLVLSLTGSLLIGCGGSKGDSSSSANPLDVSGPPADGDWVATTSFGKLVFTVSANGTKITTMSYQFSNWTCGPTTTSGTVGISSQWPITNGSFSISNTVDPGRNQTMLFSGTYNAANRKFAGTWEEVSYGSHCSGTWEATAPH
jgi:hypothetical protein